MITGTANYDDVAEVRCNLCGGYYKADSHRMRTIARIVLRLFDATHAMHSPLRWLAAQKLKWQFEPGISAWRPIMTTDITELAQSLKRRATSAKEFGESLYVKADDVLAMVEALERKEEQRANWFQMAQKLGEDLDSAEQRIAELESRTVTAEKLQESAYRAGLTAGWNLGLANNNDGFNKCLAAHAAGIKVEAE